MIEMKVPSGDRVLRKEGTLIAYIEQTSYLLIVFPEGSQYYVDSSVALADNL